MYSLESGFMELTVELMANAVDSLAGVLFVLKLSRGTLSGNRSWFFFSLLCMLTSTAFLFIDLFSILHSLIITAILYVFAFTLKKTKKFYAVLSPLLFELILILANTVFVLFFTSIFSIDISAISSGLSYERVLCLLSSKVFLCAVLILISKLLTDRKEFYFLDFLLYLISPVMTILSLYIFVVIGLNCDIEKYYLLVLVSSLGLVIANALTLFFYMRYTKNKKATYEKEVLLCLRESELSKYSESRNLYEKIRYMRHDYKEQLSYAKGLLESGQYDNAKAHLDCLLASESSLGNHVETGNRTIDAILNSKISANQELVFVVSGVIEDLSRYNDVDLVSLIGNMLENAIEETKKHENKQIEIAFSVVGQYQNITCKNPTDGKILSENPMLNTTKKEKMHHGFGVKSMRKTCETLNGMIEFYEKENSFYCHIALPL